MAPKKVAAARAVEKEPEAVSAGGGKTTPVKSKVVKLKTMSHPTTLSMVVEAIKKNSDRRGVSAQAIRNRILIAHPTVDPARLKFLLKTALNKGIEKGILIRPSDSNATGATGRFKLAKPGAKAGGDKMSENVDPNVQSKEKVKKVTKKVPKKPKAEQEESKGDKNTEKEAKGKKKAPEAAASKPKKGAAEKTQKSPAPAKKPKAKAAAVEEPYLRKEPAKMRAEPFLIEDSEEKPTAKSGKKGKK